MSVLKRFRSESKMQFYATAQKLRKDIMTLLLKDFGVRSKVRQLDIETRRMTADDRNAFLAIAERYGITAAEAEFPAWLIDFERQSLADLTRRLVLSVTAANSIYPTAFADAELRRKHQDNAIATCYQLYQEIDFAAHILPVDLTKYTPLCDAVEYEIALLKGWRKSDNKRYRELQNAVSCPRSVSYCRLVCEFRECERQRQCEHEQRVELEWRPPLMLSGLSTCRVNPEQVTQGRRGSPAVMRTRALMRPDTS